MEKKKDQVSLKAAREAEKALQQPSKLLHHVLPTLSTTTTNDATAGPSGSTEVHVAAAEDDDDTAGDASVLPEDVQVLEEDVECRFFLGVIPAGEDSERSPIHSKIHAFLYSEGPKSDEGGPSSKPAQPEKTQSSSKGKGKGKAAEIEEEVQWQDDGDENTKFDEKVSSPFDERRQKELEKALKLAPPAEFRAGWQLFLADLMLSDKVGFLRFDISIDAGVSDHPLDTRIGACTSNLSQMSRIGNDLLPGQITETLVSAWIPRRPCPGLY